MRVSLIATVLNEEGSIVRLLDSILEQSRPPDEVVIVDGGSTDGTVAVLRSYQARLPLEIVVEPGANISRGRNLAIAAASGEVIAATDAGVRLEPEWLEALLRPFAASPAPAVVCGFFICEPGTTLERAMGATTLPDSDEINPHTFLPSSRSVAFTKEAWQTVSGYPEWLDYCEDLVFDLRLKQAGYAFAWAPEAVVYFRPRLSLAAHFRQYYRYARGDGKADLWRRRHAIRYWAYAVGLVLLAGGFKLPALWLALAAGTGIYLHHPYRRLLRQWAGLPLAQKAAALAYVPAIRITGDVAKMVGYPVGVWWRWRHRPGSWRAGVRG